MWNIIIFLKCSSSAKSEPLLNSYYRVVVVKLGRNENLESLPEPRNLPLTTYEEVHRSPSSTGAYVAEAFSG